MRHCFCFAGRVNVTGVWNKQCNTMVLCPLRLSLIVGAIWLMTVLTVWGSLTLPPIVTNYGGHLVYVRPH